MKPLLIYYSKTGFTKTYAEWLSEAVPCDIKPFSPDLKIDPARYDTIIFASWLHAGSIQKLNWLRRQNLDGKRRIVLVTGASPAGAPSVSANIHQNFETDYDSYRIFYLPAGLCYDKMGFGDRLMMKLFSKILSGKKALDPEEEAMSQSLGSSFDHSSKSFLQPVIHYLHETQPS